MCAAGSSSLTGAVDDLTSAIEAMQQTPAQLQLASLRPDLLSGYLQPHRVNPTMALPPRLSGREREVVQLVSEGKTSKEIAVILGVTLKTAETHRSNVMIKLKLHSTVELVMYAIRNEIVHVQLPATVMPIPHMGNGRTDMALRAAI